MSDEPDFPDFRDRLPTPDIAGPGTLVCTCGYFKVGPITASSGLGVMAGCPHCGRWLEPWQEPES